MAHADGTTDDRALSTSSPIYRAMVGADVPGESFDSAEPAVSPPAKRSMERSLAVARMHVAAGTVHDTDGIVAPKVIEYHQLLTAVGTAVAEERFAPLLGLVSRPGARSGRAGP